ncbi:farnesyl-diphosphate farnesyltransferase [Auriculariales sp. MPI-PUGE-AT-0066]|nr:farnesyl-diphosphate farnesyltransferase [Auriculariales sp. MPI-PUGE-AT-0066]
MGASDMLKLAIQHPLEFRVMVNFWLWYEPKRDITRKSEHPTSGWDRETMRKCWGFLDQTSRSFSAVIKELDGDLARIIALFYLVLRGLDTIEDDMTLSDDVKQPLMANFHKSTVTPGWTFNGSGEKEKDRQLLVEYDNVVTEMLLLPEESRNVILDITQKMSAGMMKYAHRAALVAEGKSKALEDLFLQDGAEFDLYCHYVAGLVGEGLSRLFAASGKEGGYMAEQLVLSNSMGLMLQKTNIMRDYREDVDQGRHFWPRTFWLKHGFQHQDDLRTDASVGLDLSTHAGREARQRALWVLSEMILDTLRHAEDALDYLSLLRNQSVFNFCAIPQVMAMATLDLCFMNESVLERSVKIRKAAAVEIIMKSTNPRDVAYIFRDYARTIRQKAIPADPSYMRICVATSRIEAWAEHHFPSFVQISGGTGNVSKALNMADVRAQVVETERKRMQDRQLEKRLGIKRHAARHDPAQDDSFPLGLMAIIAGAMILFCGSIAGVLYLLASRGYFGGLDN